MLETHSLRGSGRTHQTDATDDLFGAAAPSVPARKAVVTARSRYNAVLKIIRRGHLFTGLFMTPWVFLYGVSGFLFNHPDAFPDREVRSFGRAESAGTGLDEFPDASAIAARVIEAVNAGMSVRAFGLVEPGAAMFSRDLIVSAKGGGRDYIIKLDLESHLGTVTPAAAATVGIEDVLAQYTAPLAEPPKEVLARGIPALVSKLGLDPESASIKSIPDVLFTSESHGKTYRLSYKLKSGVVSAHDDGESNERLTTRAFLTRLHKKRTYPARIDSRWFWAVSVDAASALMILWAVSGLIMWWQIKSTRTWGLLVLAASVSTAAVLALAIHRMLQLN